MDLRNSEPESWHLGYKVREQEVTIFQQTEEIMGAKKFGSTPK